MAAGLTVYPSSAAIRQFWDAHPLSASDVPFPMGSREYFAYYDRLREGIETEAFSQRLHEYGAFARKAVLDVGAGNGYVLSRYARAGASVSGVDIAPSAIELCRKRFEYQELSGDFRVAQAESLPFPDATFDCVCSMGVLHHVSDTARAVAEIHRVLKPGGRLIVMFYHRHSAQYQFKYRLVRLLKGRSMQEMVNEFDGAGNPRGDVYSRRELRAVLSAFEIDDMFVGFLTGSMLLPRIGHRIPDALLRPFAPLFGWNLYARGRKPAEGR